MIKFILSVSMLSLACADNVHVLWQGFSHKWERKSMFFSSAHPLGTIQNRVIEKPR